MSVFKIAPAKLTDSTRLFPVPETIISDYKNYLHSDIPNAVYDFRLLRSWYDQFSDAKPVMLRAEHFPINWKSKMGNSDANKNFYTDYDVKIQKGDMCIREDGLIVMLNWSIQQYINAQTTQAIECNHRITIKRHINAKADSRGFKIHDAHDETIVDNLPCVMSEYAGRPDYAVAQNTPGINADMLTVVNLQWNEFTKEIRIDDTFEWCNSTYRVINLNYSEVDIDHTFGVITLNARRVAGENV
jgi:hypothetical protein